MGLSTNAILRLAAGTMFPALMAICFFLAGKKSRRFSGLPVIWQQIIIGSCYGLVAILATETGIQLEGAVVNVRNAAPLTAGLVFGWPAGIISGLIGGVERWFTPVGDFTRLACTLGTFVAGIFGAAVRRFMMDNKKASWFYGLAVGITCEVLHMLLVFITNLGDVQRAFTVVRACALPMIISNGFATMLSIIAVALLVGEGLKRESGTMNISQSFQRGLLTCVIGAFLVTMLFTYSLQTKITDETARITLETNLEDVVNDISDASDENLLEIAERVADNMPPVPLRETLLKLAEEYGVTEINLVNASGRITLSTNKDYIGYDMASGEQSAEFLCLIRGAKSFVQDYMPNSYDDTVYRKYAGVALERGGFLQVGYDAEGFQEDIADNVRYAAMNRHVGQTGFIIIADAKGTVISDRDGHEGENIRVIGESAPQLREGECFSAEIYGEESLCMFLFREGYYIIGVLPEEEAMFSRNAAIYVLAFMEVLVFAALFAHIFFLIKKLVVKNIRKINESLSRITGGDLSVTVNVRDNQEFASLSDDINTTVATLKHYIDEAEARFAKDLEIAKTIQHSALPSVFPPYPNRRDFGIFASMDAAKEVGGDFYDFYLLDENHLAFVVADVSGKGIPGAMFMMTSKTLIKSHAESGLGVSEVFTQVNEQLCENNEAGMFVTAWMGVLDLESGLIRYANAGHNPPLVKHRDGSYEYLKGRANFVLAGMEGVRYREQQLQLSQGDEIYLYTDGVTEAHNSEKQLFGEERLLQSLNEGSGLGVEALCRKVKADVDAFVGEAEQFDDITMLCIRLNEVENKMLTLNPTMESVPTAAAFVEEQLESFGVPMKLSTRLMVAMDEIYSNIVRYSGASEAQIRLVKEGDSLKLIFRDNGKPYNPLDAEDPDITLSAEDRAVGGLGVFMVKKMMDSVEYEYTQGMNKLTLTNSL